MKNGYNCQSLALLLVYVFISILHASVHYHWYHEENLEMESSSDTGDHGSEDSLPMCSKSTVKDHILYVQHVDNFGSFVNIFFAFRYKGSKLGLR